MRLPCSPDTSSNLPTEIALGFPDLGMNASDNTTMTHIECVQYRYGRICRIVPDDEAQKMEFMVQVDSMTSRLTTRMKGS